MTQKASTDTKNINPALHNWKCSTRDNMKLMIMLTVFHLLAVPAILIALISSIYSNQRYDAYAETYAVIGVFTTAAAAFMGIFPAVSAFKCLNDKSLVDMRLALPMNSLQRFFSNFLSGLFTYLAPFLSAQVISMLLLGYGAVFMDGKTFNEWKYDALLDKNMLVPYVCDIFGQIAPVYFRALIGGLLSMLMLYAVTVFITVCCGSKFEAISYTIIFDVLLPITIFCAFYGMCGNLYGIYYDRLVLDLMAHTTVAGGVYATVVWCAAAAGEKLMEFSAVRWIIIYSLLILAFTALSYFLYRKRRAEQVSRPFVFKVIYYIILTCAMFSVLSVCSAGGLDLLPTIIITAIMYMVFEVITNRGFKRFWLSIIKYAGTFIGVAALFAVCEATEGFGAVYRVPSVSSVKSVEFNYMGFYDDFCYFIDPYSEEDRLLFKDEENIEAIINSHQIIVDNYKQGGDEHDYYGSSFTFYVTYHLKNGTSFERYYNYIPSDVMNELYTIDFSEEYKMQAAAKAKEYILVDMMNSYKNELVRYNNQVNYSNHTQFAQSHVFNTRYGIEEPAITNIDARALVERGFLEQLAEAYCDDIMAITEESWYHSEYKNVWNLSTGFGYLSVPESFQNTVALLSKFDLGLNYIENMTDYEIYLKGLVTRGMPMYTTDQWCIQNGVTDRSMIFTDYHNHHYYGDYSDEKGYHEELLNIYVYNYDENFCKLYRAAMPRNILSENGYIIDGAAVPEDMNDIAEKVIRTTFDSDYEQSEQEQYDRLMEYDNY